MAKKVKDTEADKVTSKSDNPKLDVAICDLEQVRIEPLIHLIRGQQVILYRDLALLYGVETRALKQAVRKITICDLGEKRTWFKHQVYAFLAHYKPYNQLLLS